MTTPLYNETPSTPPMDPYEIVYNPETKFFDLLFNGERFDDAPDYATADTLCQVHQALEEAEDETEWDDDDCVEGDMHGCSVCIPLERFHSWCEAAGEASVRWGLEAAGCPVCFGFHLVLERPRAAAEFGVD